MKDDQLINKKFHVLQRERILKDNDRFIYNEIANRINHSLDNIKFSLKNCLEIGYASNKISRYILSRYNTIDYYTADISSKVIKCLPNSKKNMVFDHDEWNLDKKKFDIIISNFYLHLTNNLNLLIKNINHSLSNNGFFIATFPGVNCCEEIKNCMIQTDIELYGGAYKRFSNNFYIQDLTHLLKKNNFIIPVIEIDTLELRYKKFSNLLKDIRYLGNSYIFHDRKQNFENKQYFKKVEEIYWKNFSKNNEIILQFEIIFLSAWKGISLSS